MYTARSTAHVEQHKRYDFGMRFNHENRSKYKWTSQKRRKAQIKIRIAIGGSRIFFVPKNQRFFIYLQNNI